jgi:NADH dehydrogenase/NADH:ubiquinone oxidoreductase subunit G
VGALTLKSFPFELRGWDVASFESLDPTDGFGSNTRVYISKDQIVQIEPDYDIDTDNTWLTDKGRQFFDGICIIWSTLQNNKLVAKKNPWRSIIHTLSQTLYLFDHCNSQKNKKYFFTIVLEYISIEMLSLLLILSQNYFFIRLKRAENVKINNDLESTFQLNLASDKTKLSYSNLCLLVSINPRFEGFYLNINLRKRFLKGNFKCLSLGSFLSLNFPVSFLGSNVATFKSIIEGNNLACQELKVSKSPLLIVNTELFKRNWGSSFFEMVKVFKYSQVLSNSWNGLNTLVPSLTEAGIQSVAKFTSLTSTDTNNFSSLYFLNVDLNSVQHVKKIINSKLLNYSLCNKKLLTNNFFIDQNSNYYKNFTFLSKTVSTDYLYLPSSMFYENEETFLNTEGLLKRTSKLIFQKHTKNSWQILRKIFKQIKTKVTYINKKNNHIIFFNSQNINNFKNFLHFQYAATQSLTNLSFYLNLKTQSFIHKLQTYKSKSVKIRITKLKYWLDDFFSSSKDEYSQTSRILMNCSRLIRLESTNFRINTKNSYFFISSL